MRGRRGSNSEQGGEVNIFRWMRLKVIKEMEKEAAYDWSEIKVVREGRSKDWWGCSSTLLLSLCLMLTNFHLHYSVVSISLFTIYFVSLYPNLTTSFHPIFFLFITCHVLQYFSLFSSLFISNSNYSHLSRCLILSMLPSSYLISSPPAGSCQRNLHSYITGCFFAQVIYNDSCPTEELLWVISVDLCRDKDGWLSSIICFL